MQEDWPARPSCKGLSVSNSMVARAGGGLYVHQDFIETRIACPIVLVKFRRPPVTHGPDAVLRNPQRAAEGRSMVGQSDQRHRRNDRSRGCGVLLLDQGVILFAIPIVADLTMPESLPRSTRAVIVVPDVSFAPSAGSMILNACACSESRHKKLAIVERQKVRTHV